MPEAGAEAVTLQFDAQDSSRAGMALDYRHLLRARTVRTSTWCTGCSERPRRDREALHPPDRRRRPRGVCPFPPSTGWPTGRWRGLERGEWQQDHIADEIKPEAEVMPDEAARRREEQFLRTRIEEALDGQSAP